MKILVVDDSKVSHKMLVKAMPEDVLNTSEFIHAYNGIEAVEMYKSENPDVVLMDLTMPEMDGYEATKTILEFDPEATICVITADIQTHAKDTILSLGAKKVINKPITEAKMLEIFDFLNS